MKEEERQRIVSALDSTVEEIRYQAVRRLLEVFEKPPIEHLMTALGDESWRVRKCASEVLTQADASPEMIRALIDALGEEDNAGLRNSATEVLIKIGPPAVSDLFKVLKDGAPSGGINLGFAWSQVVDEPDRWSVKLSNELCQDGPMTVDVTPRRCRKFKPNAGEKLKWTNGVSGQGEVVADEWGLVTVPKVIIKPGESTLLTIAK